MAKGNMSIKETICQEIDRLYDGEAPKHDQQCDFNDGYFTGIATISKFIDSLPDNDFLDESIIASKDIEEEMERMWLNWCEDVDYLSYLSIARHFAEWGAKHSK